MGSRPMRARPDEAAGFQALCIRRGSVASRNLLDRSLRGPREMKTTTAEGLLANAFRPRALRPVNPPCISVRTQQHARAQPQFTNWRFCVGFGAKQRALLHPCMKSSRIKSTRLKVSLRHHREGCHSRQDRRSLTRGNQGRNIKPMPRPPAEQEGI